MNETVPPPSTRPSTRHRALLAEVARLRDRESRRAFDSGVHVGTPDGDRSSFVPRGPDAAALDHALRTDVVGVLLDGVGPDPVAAWVTRPGVPEPHDLDYGWFAAAAVAFAARDRPLAGFYAITRHGWLDVCTGERVRWTATRPRRR